MDQVRVFASILKVVLSRCGYQIDDLTAELIAEGAVFGSIAVTSLLIFGKIWLWLRRRFGDEQALPEELMSVVRIIKRDTENINKHIERLGASINATVGDVGQQINSTISTRIDEIKNGNQDNVIPDEIENERKSVRLFVADGVRETIIDKFMSKDWFAESSAERHRYEFSGTSESGIPFQIALKSPYRKIRHGESNADFILEIFANNRRVLNFEWTNDDHTSSKVIYLARDRSWFEDLVDWKFTMAAKEPKNFAVAAE